jgi:GWxTD domain-containing protein
MSLSDIELCTEIRDSAVNRDSPFYKNTKEVQPNPSMLYGMGLPILYYYAEVYNLKSDSRSTDLFLTSAVIDAAGHEVLHKTKKKPRTFDSSIEVGTMNLSTLSEGTYILRLTLADSLRKPFAQSSRKFFVYNPRNRVRDTSAVKAPSAMGAFEFMTEAELDREFRYIRYIATDRDRSQYEQLTGVDAKRSFLFTFWTARDIDRTTERNEYRDEYLQRVRFAQESYTVGPHEGWQSDRGRIRIMYGEPDEVERNPSNQETYPYEIWQFDKLQGGVIFVFVDTMGMNDFQLVHSTHRNELQNENWMEEYARKPFNH